jgi:osmotically-inducible protein OsmY
MKKNKNLLIRVQEALAKETSLKTCLNNIYIFVNDSGVIVAGSVKQEFLKTLIQKIISAVPGVNFVIDDLQVEPAISHRVGVQIDWAKGSMALV